MKKPLAILEGGLSRKMAGWTDIMIVTRGTPKMCLARDGGASSARQLGVPHYASGTWEMPDSPSGAFPLPRPEILTQIYGTKQAEMKMEMEMTMKNAVMEGKL